MPTAVAELPCPRARAQLPRTHTVRLLFLGGLAALQRGASIWDTFTGADTTDMPGSVCNTAPCPINTAGGMYAEGATGNVANDHRQRYKDDVAMMKSMGLKHYRFSISWPRLVPLGNASAQSDGVCCYGPGGSHNCTGSGTRCKAAGDW